MIPGRFIFGEHEKDKTLRYPSPALPGTLMEFAIAHSLLAATPHPPFGHLLPLRGEGLVGTRWLEGENGRGA